MSLGGAILRLPTPFQATASDGTVTQVSFMGSVLRIRMDVAGEPLSFDVFNNPRQPAPEAGNTVLAHLSSRDLFQHSA